MFSESLLLKRSGTFKKGEFMRKRQNTSDYLQFTGRSKWFCDVCQSLSLYC